MSLPPESFDNWLKNPRCPNCTKRPGKIPDDQRVQCICGLEYVVLSRSVENASKKTVQLYWMMPAAEFFENIDEVWQRLRSGGPVSFE